MKTPRWRTCKEIIYLSIGGAGTSLEQGRLIFQRCGELEYAVWARHKREKARAMPPINIISIASSSQETRPSVISFHVFTYAASHLKFCDITLMHVRSWRPFPGSNKYHGGLLDCVNEYILRSKTSKARETSASQLA